MELIKKDIFVYIVLSILFAITVQQFPFFKGNSLHLIHAIKNFEFNKLQNDWIANTTNHLPLFTIFNHFLIKFFSLKILHLIHLCLLSLCSLFLFLICKTQFKELKNPFLSLVWFSLFIIIYHENSLFGGVAGQDVINEGYQPASFGVLFFVAIYLFLINKNFFSILFICLAASFHPTYVLHSGFLMLGIFSYYIFKKEYVKTFKISIIYSILILPITLYIILNFFFLDKNLILEGQKILLDRAVHHAVIQSWFSYKDLLSILIYLISLIIIYKEKKFFIPFFVFGFMSIIFSFIQFFFENNTLALSFPWRTSVFLVPISTMIILSFFIQNFFDKKKYIKILSIILIFFSVSIFSVKNHLIENSNKNFHKKMELINKIKENYVYIDRLLIPVSLEDVRMNIGLPIFVDWKHPPFKFNEIIEWKSRMSLASSFFAAKNFDQKMSILNEINEIENISHVLINKKDLIDGCKDLIDDIKYSLVSKKDCYQ